MRKVVWAVLILGLILSSVQAREFEAVLSDFHWEKRQLLVFTPSKNDARYVDFQAELQSSIPGLKERNLIVWRILDEAKVSLNDQAVSDLSSEDFRNYFDVESNRFMVILLGYDGEEKLRMTDIDIETIFVTIDGMPIRQMEMQEAAEKSK